MEKYLNQNNLSIQFKDVYPKLEKLFQETTYYGVIEGTPNQEVNKSIVEAAGRMALRYLNVKTIHVIQPEEEILGPDNFGGVKAQLPKITCMAELTHYYPMKNPDAEASRLGLVWFQQKYAAPLAPDIREAILKLEWKELSEDYDWS